MKINKLRWFLAFIIIFSFITSCSKEDEESALDCFAESLKTSLHFEISSINPKQVNYVVKYVGDKPITSIVWHYGDNTTINSTGHSTSHTYNSAGTYEVTADVTIDGKCTVSPKKSVVIQ